MKTKLLFATLLLMCWSAPAQFLSVSNPVPTVPLGWTPPAGTNVITNYFMYFGVGPGQYTSRVSLGNVTNATIVLPAYGTTYYFAATCQDNNGLESPFSNMISYSTPSVPGSPGLLAPLKLTAQSRRFDSNWTDEFAWNVSPDSDSKQYRLVLALRQPVPPPPMPR